MAVYLGNQEVGFLSVVTEPEIIVNTAYVKQMDLFANINSGQAVETPTATAMQKLENILKNVSEGINNGTV